MSRCVFNGVQRHAKDQGKGGGRGQGQGQGAKREEMYQYWKGGMCSRIEVLMETITECIESNGLIMPSLAMQRHAKDQGRGGRAEDRDRGRGKGQKGKRCINIEGVRSLVALRFYWKRLQCASN